MKLAGIIKKIPRPKIEKRVLLRCLAALAGGVIFLFCQPIFLPLVRGLLGQAALFSAAITMPQSTLLSLQDRFAGEESEPPVSESQSQQQPPSSSLQTPDEMPEPELPGQTEPPSTATSRPDLGPRPEIPQKYRGPLVSLRMDGEAGNPAFLHQGNVWLRNYTKMSRESISEVLEEDCALSLEPGDAPQVLIYHTHTTESYEGWDSDYYDIRNSWRDTDNTNNMAAAGEVLAEGLRRNGISVIHDDTQHDYPSYNGAYDRSRKTIDQYLEEYPSIRVTIDLHRDGIVKSDNTVLKPVVEVNGKKAAQLMMIAPCDDGSVGVPGWQENLRFAAELQSSIEDAAPGLCRPIFFCYRNYNLGVTDASLLFELGTNGNTLEEALYSAELLAEPMAKVLKEHLATR